MLANPQTGANPQTAHSHTYILSDPVRTHRSSRVTVLTLPRSSWLSRCVSSPRSLSFRVPSRLTGHHSSFRGKEPAPREPIGRRPRSRRRPVTTTGGDARPNGDDDARRTVSVSFAPASRVTASRSRVARRPRVAGGAIRADKTAGSRANRATIGPRRAVRAITRGGARAVGMRRAFSVTFFLRLGVHSASVRFV